MRRRRGSEEKQGMRYIRMYKGSEDGAPGVTLYEVDREGWVHRQLQVHAEGVRFSPEDILLRRPVSVGYMVKHPDAEEISAEDFELHWAEFDHRRRFRERIPNPWRAWYGQMSAGGEDRELRWVPSGAHPGEGWARVPGFVRLYVRGGSREAWATQRALFLEADISWVAYHSDDVELPTRQVVEGPGLAAALHGDRFMAMDMLT
ncbi:hypothetical protein G6O69_36670 [Pseudenhygromyxa sp. WMMC2535]|uniref:hypothetical protein n=1 Tax=Pseudenhygromyxa sp. WMMC2535 TaxID=2712867 RepID=UPI001596180E|nr:hypothetical protein [Pseudenhygromyxa sp. WMMC2535]NVB36218.1 hypothetical protein [Pseudenhygromyxa sp. WMMC2535]NVB43417.1 hypothetical protein [Pseudenhygromyxa sp. WMMC2535]